MPKMYQNIQATRSQSSFVEVLNRPSAEVTFDSRVASVTRAGVSERFTSLRMRFARPLEVKACGNECVTGIFDTGFTLSANVKYNDVAALDAMKAEVDRLFAAAKANLVAGIVPGAASTFSED